MLTSKYPRGVFLIKLLLPFMAASLLGSISLILLLYFKGGQLLETQLKQRVLDEFNFLEFEFREDGPIELLEEIEERIEKSQHAWRFFYHVQGPNNEQAFDFLAVSPMIGWSQISTDPYSETSLVYTKNLGDHYQLSVGITTDDLRTYRHTFFTNAGWLVFAGFLISTLFGVLVYHRFISIVKAIATPVQQFTDGKFSARVGSLDAEPNLNRLASNINHMFEQIERLIDQLKKLSANMAHELRTPLTRVKQHLTAAANDANEPTLRHLRAAESDIDEVLGLFREILQLSEIQSGRLQAYFENLNLSALIHECVELYRPLLEDQNIITKLHVTDNVVIRSSPQLMKQVLVNLIENSLSHSQGNSELNIELIVVNDHIRLNVIDGGKKLSTSPKRKHYGLGLNFVTAIIELHGGRSTFNTIDGEGFICAIQLPLNR